MSLKEENAKKIKNAYISGNFTLPIVKIKIFQNGHANLIHRGRVSSQSVFRIFAKDEDELRLIYDNLRIDKISESNVSSTAGEDQLRSDDNAQKTTPSYQIFLCDLEVNKYLKLKKANLNYNMVKDKNLNYFARILSKDALTYGVSFWDRFTNVAARVYVNEGESDPIHIYEGIIIKAISISKEGDKYRLILYNDDTNVFAFIDTSKILKFEFKDPKIQEDFKKILLEKQILEENFPYFSDTNILVDDYYEKDKWIEVRFNEDGLFTISYLRSWAFCWFRYILEINGQDYTLKREINLTNSYYEPLPPIEFEFLTGKRIIAPIVLDNLNPIRTQASVTMKDKPILTISEESEVEIDSDSNIGSGVGTASMKVTFRLTGVPPDQAIKKLRVNKNLTIAEIKRIVRRAYRLNPVLAVQFILRGRVLPDNLVLKKLNFKSSRDIITVMLTQAGGPGLHLRKDDKRLPSSNRAFKYWKSARTGSVSMAQDDTKEEGDDSDFSSNLVDELPDNVDPVKYVMRLEKIMEGKLHGWLHSILKPFEETLIPLESINFKENPIKLIYYVGFFDYVYKTLLFNTNDNYLFQGLFLTYENNELLNESILGESGLHETVLFPIEKYHYVRPFFTRDVVGEPTGEISVKKTTIALKAINEELDDQDYDNLVHLVVPIKFQIMHRIDLVNIHEEDEEIIVAYQNMEEYIFQSIKYFGNVESGNVIDNSLNEGLYSNGDETSEDDQDLLDDQGQNLVFQPLVVEEDELLCSMAVTPDYKFFKIKCPKMRNTRIEFSRMFTRIDHIPINEKLVDYENIKSLIKKLPVKYANSLEEMLNLIKNIKKARTKYKTDKLNELQSEFNKLRLKFAASL
ncbi:MAG: hypothetical protein ACTSU2_17385 [Promethearchaeota archaeon]